MSDTIHIRDLEISCIIGTRPWERENRQNVVLNVALTCDLREPGRTDRLEDTVDYVGLKDRIHADVAAGDYHLIERVADRVARICLENPGVSAAAVTVDKPGALTGTRSVAVEIHRTGE